MRRVAAWCMRGRQFALHQAPVASRDVVLALPERQSPQQKLPERASDGKQNRVLHRPTEMSTGGEVRLLSEVLCEVELGPAAGECGTDPEENEERRRMNSGRQ